MSQAGILNTAGGPSPPSVATSYATDAGTATPALNILNVLGGSGNTTAAPGNSNTITIISSFYNYVRTSAATYSATATDYFISCDTTSNSITVRLPNAPVVGRQFTVKDAVSSAPANTITVTTVDGAVSIDGMTSQVLSTDGYDSMNLFFNGTAYEIS